MKDEPSTGEQGNREKRERLAIHAEQRISGQPKKKTNLEPNA
jgi:hypothetical protein